MRLDGATGLLPPTAGFGRIGLGRPPGEGETERGGGIPGRPGGGPFFGTSGFLGISLDASVER